MTISPARRNWQRAVSIAIQAGTDDDRAAEGVTAKDEESSHLSEIVHQTQPKLMDLQYFLEMVDVKHRHGSNLRAYHTIWKNSPSHENFFYWLDHGEGRSIDLPQCPRERLEREQVRYLSPEERFDYLVEVDGAGLFRWAKNHELVDTDDKLYRDSVHGVVRIHDDAPRFQRYSEDGSIEREGESSRPVSRPLPSIARHDDREHYGSSKPGHCLVEEKAEGSTHATPAAMYDRFATNFSIKKGTWLFVGTRNLCQVRTQLTALTHTGRRFVISYLHWDQRAWCVPAFFVSSRRPNICGRHAQDSARSAPEPGSIEVSFEEIALTPYEADFRSGHYRPHFANFRAFHHSLQDRGVDLSHVSISKSYAVLAGIEGYASAKHKLRALHQILDTTKDKLHLTPPHDAEHETRR